MPAARRGATLDDSRKLDRPFPMRTLLAAALIALGPLCVARADAPVREEPFDEVSSVSRGVVARFTAEGAKIAPARPDGHGWEIGVGLAARLSAPVERSPVVRREAGRIEYVHGPLTEWFLPTELGLEQGFTVARHLRGESEVAGVAPERGRLEIDLALSGAGSVKLSADGRTIEVLTADGRQALRGSGLRGIDATGREVTVRTELAPQVDGAPLGVRLVADVESGHAYPLTIAWVWTSIEAAKDPISGGGDVPGSPARLEAADATVRARIVVDGTGARTLAPPANDQCAGALSISSAGPGPYVSPITPDITDATTTGDPVALPPCTSGFPSSTVSRSVWYTFAPSASGRYTVSVCAGAPTGTTVVDTVMAIYTSAGGCGGPYTQVTDGCDDDGCVTETLQSEFAVDLTSGTVYRIVLWQFGTPPPDPGDTAVQVRVSPVAQAPSNDTCAAPTTLTLNNPQTATLSMAFDDYELSGVVCFGGVGQIATFASGRDAVHTFTAPTADSYSFRVQNLEAGGNPVLYLATECQPAVGGQPVVVGCLTASNRTSSASGFASEEVACLGLAAGQQVYLYVDESTAAAFGGTYRLEASRCVAESEPNETPGGANALACGIKGAIGPAGDVDFYGVGTAPSDSRVFALVDGAPANINDFDMRVTTATDTLEYDDLNADVPFGGLSPTVGGTKLTGVDGYVRVSQFSAGDSAEPYRLYAVVQPPASGAAEEVEPNGTVQEAQSNTASVNYFHGVLPGPAPSSDVDLYGFTATAGDVVFLGLDADPGYDGTAVNAALALLDTNGAPLMSVNDSSASSSLRAAVSGSLTSTTPTSPAEALQYRVTRSGTYIAKVVIGTTFTGSTGAGDYLLSVSRNCAVGGGGVSADVSVGAADTPDPVVTGALLTYTVTVSNAGPGDALGVTANTTLPAQVVFVSTSGCAGDPAGVPTCALGTVDAASSKQFTVTVRVKTCIGSGSLTTDLAVSSTTPDLVPGNNGGSAITTLNDTGTCDDGVPCTGNDVCNGALCAGSPLTVPTEVTNLRLLANKTTLVWNSASGGPGTVHDVPRGLASQLPVGGGAAEICFRSGVAAATTTDSASPAPGNIFWYLVRGRNTCGTGTYGTTSGGTTRTTSTCP